MEMPKTSGRYFLALHCRVCNNFLQDNFKTLPCLHSYCFQCLVDNFTEQLKKSPQYGLPDNFFDEDDFHCPLCFMEVPVTKGESMIVQTNAIDSVNQLEPVYFLTHLLKRVKLLNSRQKCERCIPVYGSALATAIAFCNDCERNYCSSCVNKHNEFISGHTLFNLINENEKIMPVSDSDFKEESRSELRNTNSSSPEEDSSDFMKLSIADDRDASSINVRSHLSYAQRLNTLLDDDDDALSTSAGPIYNFNFSATARSTNRRIIHRVRKKFNNSQALRKIVIPSECSIHKLSFIAYCSRCELCLCQLCWEKHSTEFKDCMNIVPLKTVAFEKRRLGYTLLAAVRQLIKPLTEKFSESLKKLEPCTEKCFDKNEVVHSSVDDTIEAFQNHHFRQNQLYCKQLLCFKTFLSDVLHLVPDGDLTICFSSITAFWHRLSSKFINKTALSQIEPAKCNFQNLYKKVETLSVTVDQDNLGYSDQRSFQITRVSMIKTEHTVQSKVIDRPSFISSSVVDSTCFALKEIDYISAISVSKDLHILLCLYFQSCIKIYDSKGQFLTSVQTPGEPSDICADKDSNFLVVLPLRKKIVILQASKPDRKSGKKKTYFVSKVVDVKRCYVSIFKICKSIIACDVYKNVDIIQRNGTVVHYLLKQTNPNPKPSAHRLSSGPFTDSFLLLDYLYQTISCYDLKGRLQFCIDTKTEGGDSNGTSDICLGMSGRIYVSDCHSIYSMKYTYDPQVLWTFEEELIEEASIVFSPVTNHLVVSCFSRMDTSLLILNISKP